MDMTILSRPGAIRLLMEIGDEPDQTVRHLITHGGSPSPSLRACIGDLQTAGLAEGIPAVFRGKSVTRIRLTDRGMDVYRLLCVIRGL